MDLKIEIFNKFSSHLIARFEFLKIFELMHKTKLHAMMRRPWPVQQCAHPAQTREKKFRSKKRDEVSVE